MDKKLLIIAAILFILRGLGAFVAGIIVAVGGAIIVGEYGARGFLGICAAFILGVIAWAWIEHWRGRRD